MFSLLLLQQVLPYSETMKDLLDLSICQVVTNNLLESPIQLPKNIEKLLRYTKNHIKNEDFDRDLVFLNRLRENYKVKMPTLTDNKKKNKKTDIEKETALLMTEENNMLKKENFSLKEELKKENQMSLSVSKKKTQQAVSKMNIVSIKKCNKIRLKILKCSKCTKETNSKIFNEPRLLEILSSRSFTDYTFVASGLKISTVMKCKGNLVQLYKNPSAFMMNTNLVSSDFRNDPSFRQYFNDFLIHMYGFKVCTVHNKLIKI